MNAEYQPKHLILAVTETNVIAFLHECEFLEHATEAEMCEPTLSTAVSMLTIGDQNKLLVWPLRALSDRMPQTRIVKQLIERNRTRTDIWNDALGGIECLRAEGVRPLSGVRGVAKYIDLRNKAAREVLMVLKATGDLNSIRNLMPQCLQH